MKKHIVLLLLSIAGLFLQSFAQTPTTSSDQHQELKIDFLQFMIMGNFGVQYEYFLKNEQGIGLSANYFSVDYWGDHVEGYSFFTEYRWYMKEKSEHKGFFVAPYMKYRHKKEDGGFGYYVDENGDYTNDWYEQADYVESWKTSSGLAFGISGGYKVVLKSNFMVEANVGFGRYIFDNWEFADENAAIHNTTYIYWEDKADLKANFSIGWRF